ncbi:MAG TPA: AAA family ATPase [Burkholderiaceae bacterium]
MNEVARVFDTRSGASNRFSTPAAEQIHRTLLAGLASASDEVLVLVGAPGVGKTLQVQTLWDTLPPRWSRKARLSFTLMSRAEILHSVAHAFGMPKDEKRAPREWFVEQLRSWAKDDQGTLLLVDEAQGLPPDALRGLMALGQLKQGGLPLLRIVLMGQPALLDLLDAPELIIIPLSILSLPGFRPTETAAYIQDRLSRYAGPRLPPLSAAALSEIHARTQGRPGRINNLCVRLLHTAILHERLEPIGAASVVAEAEALAFHPQTELLAALIKPPAVPVLRQVVTPSLPDEAALAELLEGPASPRPTPRAAPRLLPIVMAAAVLLGVGLMAGSWLQSPGAAPLSRVASAAPLVQPTVATLAPAEVNRSPSNENPIKSEATTVAVQEPLRQVSEAPILIAPAAGTPALEHGTSEACKKLLVQVSLGEPLSEAQKQTLESACK